MWYELEPLPGQGVDDQHVYLEQARRAAAALGLSDRPSIDTWWRMLTHRDDGMILAADRTGRWVCLPDGVDTDVIRILAAACHAKARQLDEAPGILTTRLKWAHAIMPASATCFASMSFQQAHQYFSAVWADGFPRSRHHAVSDVR